MRGDTRRDSEGERVEGLGMGVRRLLYQAEEEPQRRGRKKGATASFEAKIHKTSVARPIGGEESSEGNTGRVEPRRIERGGKKRRRLDELELVACTTAAGAAVAIGVGRGVALRLRGICEIPP